VTCDDAWLTRSALVRLRDRGGERRLALTAEGGRWTVNGQVEVALEGCVDVDLGWSPSTNTLPIRRLHLAPGESSGPVTAAWVRFPDLRVQALSQEYRRLSESRYRYTSGRGAFSADLEVDPDGLVLEYKGQWTLVGEPDQRDSTSSSHPRRSAKGSGRSR
jgi:uncharacterized protein